MDAFSEPVFMDTIYSMHPIFLNEICEMAKQDMKDEKVMSSGHGNVL